jgi:3-mercaptopyruvate sulfurtransferase SseA
VRFRDARSDGLQCVFPLEHPSMPSTSISLARPRQLVTPAQLAAAPAHWRVLEVGFNEAAVHAAGHIRGAGYLDTSALETAPLWNKVDDAALLGTLLGLGIGAHSTVLLYGRNQLAAARAAQLMLYAGVRDVRLLDGGLPAWLADGYALTDAATKAAAPLAWFGAPFPGRPDYLIDSAGAARLRTREDGVLASIRSWTEHAGLTSGYSYIAARGEIAGARWGRAGRDGDVNSMSDYHDDAGRMLPPASIARMWREQGIGPEQAVAFFCGTGWRASLAFYYAWLMGWERISVYDGGWGDWSRDSANPVQCGAPRACADNLHDAIMPLAAPA